MSKDEELAEDFILVTIWVLNFHLKDKPSMILYLHRERMLTGEGLSLFLQNVVALVLSDKLSHDDLRHVVKFLTYISQARHESEAVKNFWQDYVGLPMCLKLSKESIKRLLIDNQENAEMFQQWALLAKQAADHFGTDECLFMHSLLDQCFINILKSKYSGPDAGAY